MEQSTPLVSIILPTYNRSDMLAHAIRSVLAQTYGNIEVIIVEDHSPDNTAEVVSQFTDPRIRYYRNEQNMKLPRTLNRGFSLAKGDFMTWTSDDNMYAQDAIEKMVACAISRQCEFVFADYFHFSESDTKTGQASDPVHIKLPDTLQLEKCNQVGACFLYSRKVYETIGDYDPDLFLIEDYDYFIRVSKAFKIAHIAEPLYYFRRHDDSLYCSRYFEVKASDLLVRYKNQLLSPQQVAHATADLVLDNTEMLKSDLIRNGLAGIKKLSYRLTNLSRRLFYLYLTQSLNRKISAILRRYDTEEISFRDGRDGLVELLSNVVKLEYKG